MKSTEEKKIDAFKRRLEEDPLDLDNVLELVRCYNHGGKPGAALELCRAMMKYHSRAYSFLLEFANVLYGNGDAKEARVVFKKLTEFRPERLEAWNNLGILELANGRLEEAHRAFGKVLELEPANAGALCNTGNYFAEKGDAALAATYFERALEECPKFPEAWYNLGNSYMSLNQFEEAKTAFEKAIRHDKSFGSAYKNLGFVCEQLEEYEKALEYYIKASLLNKADAGVQINMAGMFIRFDQFEKALACGKRAVSLAPGNPQSWNALSRAATNLGDGETYYRAVIAMINSISESDLAHAISDLREMGFLLEAEELLEYSVKINKTGVEVDALPFTESAAHKVKPSTRTIKAVGKKEAAASGRKLGKT